MKDVRCVSESLQAKNQGMEPAYEKASYDELRECFPPQCGAAFFDLDGTAWQSLPRYTVVYTRRGSFGTPVGYSVEGVCATPSATSIDVTLMCDYVGEEVDEAPSPKHEYFALCNGVAVYLQEWNGGEEGQSVCMMFFMDGWLYQADARWAGADEISPTQIRPLLLHLVNSVAEQRSNEQRVQPEKERIEK